MPKVTAFLATLVVAIILTGCTADPQDPFNQPSIPTNTATAVPTATTVVIIVAPAPVAVAPTPVAQVAPAPVAVAPAVPTMAPRMQVQAGPAINMVQSPADYADCPSPKVLSELVAINGKGPAWRSIGNPAYNGGKRNTDDVCVFSFNRNELDGKSFIEFAVPAGAVVTNNEPDHKVRLWVGKDKISGSAATLRLLDDPRTGKPIYARDHAFRNSCTLLRNEFDFTEREMALGGFDSIHDYGNVSCAGGTPVYLGIGDYKVGGSSASTTPIASAKPVASNGTSPLSGGTCTFSNGAWACGQDKVKVVWTVIDPAITIDLWSQFATPSCEVITQSGDGKTIKCPKGATFEADKITVRKDA